MNIYLIRHGETTHNRDKVHQKPDTELTEKGIEQARIVGELLKKYTIDLIFSSPLKRTLQTTQIIADMIGKPVKIDTALTEKRQPSIVVGKPYDHPEAICIRKEMRDNYHIIDWRHSDEENFIDLKDRIAGFMRSLESQKYENIVIITHEMFIKIFVALLIFQDNLHARLLLDFYDRTSISNGSITLCSYTSSKWGLRYLNNVEHLSELDGKL